MYKDLPVKAVIKVPANNVQTALSELLAAQGLFKQNREQGWAALNSLFRAGGVPEPPLTGQYAGELIALDVAPGLTQFYQWLTDRWMPWQGKAFSATRQQGDNFFTKDSYLLTRIFNPFYRGFIEDGLKTYRAFAFHTYIAPGLFDPDRSVLKIDYNSAENPSLTVRRVLDELVQLEDGLYLGKAHLKWWRPADGWQTVAYFTLMSQSISATFSA
jgi:hypothetical protein